MCRRPEESTVVQHGSESRIGPQEIPLGIDRKKNQVDVALFEGSLKIIQRLIGLFQSSMYQRHRISWNISFSRDHF